MSCVSKTKKHNIIYHFQKLKQTPETLTKFNQPTKDNRCSVICLKECAKAFRRQIQSTCNYQIRISYYVSRTSSKSTVVCIQTIVSRSITENLVQNCRILQFYARTSVESRINQNNWTQNPFTSNICSDVQLQGQK